MKIGIFLGVVGRQASGPEIYETSLVRQLAQLDRENEYHLYCLSPEAAEALQIHQRNVQIHVLWPPQRPLSILFTLPIRTSCNKIEMLHSTFLPPPIVTKPLIMTLHGTDMFVHPEYFRPSVRMQVAASVKHGLRQARMIICVSEHIADFISRQLGVPTGRIAVIYHGVEPNFRPIPRVDAMNEVRRRYGIKRSFILYVGKLVAGKNIDRMLEAYHGFLRQTNADVDLVLAGRTYPSMTAVVCGTTREHPGSRVRVLGHVPHDQLPALFSASLMFLFPSLWEGFGLPIIEAMACGTPVITSNVACLPEIAGGAARLVNPESVPEIHQAITSLYESRTEREDLTGRGVQRARRFTWQGAAEQTLEIYRRVHGGVRP